MVYTNGEINRKKWVNHEFYAALGKLLPLPGLWSAAFNHPELNISVINLQY